MKWILVIMIISGDGSELRMHGLGVFDTPDRCFAALRGVDEQLQQSPIPGVRSRAACVQPKFGPDV
jgi:hypothetical protein